MSHPSTTHHKTLARLLAIRIRTDLVGLSAESKLHVLYELTSRIHEMHDEFEQIVLQEGSSIPDPDHEETRMLVLAKDGFSIFTKE